jgi:hypothetical protein
VPFFDQSFGIVIAGFWGVQQLLRRVAVHQHLASGQAHSKLLGFLEQSVYRLGIDRAVDASARDAIAQILLKKNLGD